jgi:Fe-S cluster assembly protein SufD
MNAVQRYLSVFEALAARATEPAAFSRIRRAAIERFVALGLPTTRMEAWRFTNVAPLAERDFVLAPGGRLGGPSPSVRACARAAVASQLVFVNGRYAPALSDTSRLPAGVTVESLGEMLPQRAALLESHLAGCANFDDHAFVALNTAFTTDGAVVHIPDGAVVEAPIGVTYLSETNGTPYVSHPRTLIVAGTHSQAAIVESYAAAGGMYFTNAVTEIFAGPGARLEHYKLQFESEAALHVGAVAARQARDSRVTYHSVSLGGALVRNDVHVVLEGVVEY